MSSSDWKKMAAILQTTFLKSFSWKKLIKILLRSVPKSPIVNKSVFNGLAPNRQEAITSTNVDQGVWCHMASQGLSELTTKYCQVSNISHTKSQHLQDYRTVLWLSLPNPLKPDVKSRMKMYLEQRRQAMFQLHLTHWQFYCLLRCNLF